MCIYIYIYIFIPRIHVTCGLCLAKGFYVMFVFTTCVNKLRLARTEATICPLQCSKNPRVERFGHIPMSRGEFCPCNVSVGSSRAPKFPDSCWVNRVHLPRKTAPSSAEPSPIAAGNNTSTTTNTSNIHTSNSDDN